MYKFENLKSVVFRNKYDIVIEREKKTVTYFELYGKVNALFNALTNMGVGGPALVMAEDVQSLVVTAFALSKCGVKRIICDSNLPSFHLKNALDIYCPSIVFLTPDALSKNSELLLEKGCKTAVVYGKGSFDFPKVFSFDELIDKNDYTLISEYTATDEIEFYGSNGSSLPKELTYEKSGMLIDIPCHSKAFAEAFSEIIDSSCKCFTGDFLPVKKLWKKAVGGVLTDTDREKLYADSPCPIYLYKSGLRRIGNSYLDCDDISRIIADCSGEEAFVSFNGAVINVTVSFEKNADKKTIEESIPKIRAVAKDLLSPFDIKKTIAFKQKN